jgi:2-polyprenyl-3-methyl-5-hydroxy-6-metoxy-1,4-benzoquinol methylase
LDNSASFYALGSTDAEHDRLIRQAARLAPYTERFFREAGIRAGQRVLDAGSGVGDVAMLAARLVGPSGEVLGVERDARSIAKARARADEAGLRNISFTQSDVSEISSDRPFDATVGRYILMYLPDPVGVLRSLSRLVRPGGVLAFQDATWLPILALSAQRPLWSAVASLIVEAFELSGADPEMGMALYRTFQKAGLATPRMHLDVLFETGPAAVGEIHDIFRSLQPQIARTGLKLAPLGDLDTLPARLEAELAASDGPATWLGLVGAWCRKPADDASI